MQSNHLYGEIKGVSHETPFLMHIFISEIQIVTHETKSTMQTIAPIYLLYLLYVEYITVFLPFLCHYKRFHV